jgi:hypothetical protein
VIRL